MTCPFSRPCLLPSKLHGGEAAISPNLSNIFARDFYSLKLFPASSIGGISFLKAMHGPYGHLNIQFMPMGRVNPENMSEYLAQPNVIAVGGSWLAAPHLIKNKDYAAIEKKAATAIKKQHH